MLPYKQIQTTQSQSTQSQPQTSRSLVNGTKAPQNQNQSQSQNPNQKRVRVVSKPTQNKKPKAQTVTAASRGQDALKVDGKDDRPVSSLMMDAIPTWSEPIVKDGNWDNVSFPNCQVTVLMLAWPEQKVVLPVVARKMGLDGQYEEVDGASHPKKPPREEIVQPVCF